ncbi:MAG: hypothetical protein ABI813_01085 [Bacteroidota bacterium]
MHPFNKLPGIIFSVCLFFACSNNSSTAAGEKTPIASLNSSGDSTYIGNNGLAYTINGRHVAIKQTMHDGDGKNWIALYSNEVKNDVATSMVIVNLTNELTKEVFNFSVANSGNSSILHYIPSISNFTNKKNAAATYMSSKYINYYGDSVMVKITSINATRVAGTFSGKFLSDDDNPVRLEITDGSFDVAFTKDKVY